MTLAVLLAQTTIRLRHLVIIWFVFGAAAAFLFTKVLKMFGMDDDKAQKVGALVGIGAVTVWIVIAGITLLAE